MNNISPCEKDIQTYFYVVFGFCEGFIPCRSFPEKGADQVRPPHNIWIEADDNATLKAFTFAKWADKEKVACYVIPGTVAKEGRGSSADVLQMQTVLVDLDTGDTEAKLKTLTESLLDPTLIVESGGVTGDDYKKLHVYWQLSEPAEGIELKKLLKLRHHIALSIGGDIHFQSAHQPIRVAGSTYHKDGNYKLVTIRSYNPVEYDLDDLIEFSENLPTPENLPSYNKGGNFLDFNNAAMSIDEILTSKVYEGGEGEHTRFNNLSKVMGHFVRLYWNGTISSETLWEDIAGYNEARVVPPKDEVWLKKEVGRIWDLHVKKHGEPPHIFKESIQQSSCKSFSLGVLLDDCTPFPDDIIAPRILTPSGLMVFGGAPKVGKSDFLLSMFTHLAAGIDFLSFKPSRPLKIFYFQAEIGYHYLRERLQAMNLPQEVVELAKDNLFITPNTKLQLNEEGVNDVVSHVQESFKHMPDIIAVDPIRNVFDGGSPESSENNNNDMLFFLQQRIEPLRDKINTDAGIVLVHHTKKIDHRRFKEDPFQAFSGASSLRGYYTTGVILHKPDPESIDRELVFELRNGADIPNKIVNKTQDGWIEINPINKRIANQARGEKLDTERERKDKLILKILKQEALQGRAYTVNAFCEAFDSHRGLGGKESIKERLKTLMTKGYIKYFKNTQVYGISNCRSKYGLLCFKEMEFLTPDGELKPVIPTHYKHHEHEAILDEEDPDTWVIYEEVEQ